MSVTSSKARQSLVSGFVPEWIEILTDFTKFSGALSLALRWGGLKSAEAGEKHFQPGLQLRTGV